MRGVIRRESPTLESIYVVTQKKLAHFPVCPAGLIVIDGAPFSHPMIALLGLGVPTVMVTGTQADDLPDGTEVLLDGSSGVITDATGAVFIESVSPPMPPAGQPLRTRDGTAIWLRASVRDAAAARKAVTRGAASIGLVRSEFLAPENGRIPDVAFFEHALGDLCEAAQPLPVTVRLVDIAADKRPSWLGSVSGVAGPLGLQGARLYDTEPVRSVFRAEVKAVGRLASHYDIRLLIPYVVRLEELRHWRAEIMRLLTAPLPIGAMAETPVAALELANWCKEADFVALGCNDLMQCLYAADRDLPELRAYLDPYAPVLFRFLELAAQTSGACLQEIQVCGLLPQIPGIFPVLLGLGYRCFSIDPVFIPHMAQAISQMEIASAQRLAVEICAATTAGAVRDRLSLPRAE